MAQLKNGGFTLIELMIVLALLGMLGALAAGGYQGFRQNLEDNTAEKTLRNIEDAFLYARTLEEDSDSAIDQVDSLLSEELRGQYEITVDEDTYTIVYHRGEKEYKLENALYEQEDPESDPVEAVDTFTGQVYTDMVKVCTDLLHKGTKEKHDYFKAHGYTHPNNSLGNDAYRSFLFNTVYAGSWPAMSQEYCDFYNLPGGPYFIQPYVENNLKPENVVVFASKNNSTSGNWYTNLINFDGVWYYGGKHSLSVTKEYKSLKAEVTTTWTALR